MWASIFIFLELLFHTFCIFSVLKNLRIYFSEWLFQFEWSMGDILLPLYPVTFPIHNTNVLSVPYTSLRATSDTILIFISTIKQV